MNYRVATTIGLVGLASLGLSQERLMRPLPGSKELGISGNWTTDNGTGTYRVEVEGGYYVTESLVAVARIGIIKHSPAQLQYFLGGHYELRISGITLPYFFAGVEVHNTARPNNSGSVGLVTDPLAGPQSSFMESGMGLNFFLNSHTAGYAELTFFKPNDSNAIGTDLRFGLRMFFK